MEKMPKIISLEEAKKKKEEEEAKAKEVRKKVFGAIEDLKDERYEIEFEDKISSFQIKLPNGSIVNFSKGDPFPFEGDINPEPGDIKLNPRLHEVIIARVKYPELGLREAVEKIRANKADEEKEN